MTDIEIRERLARSEEAIEALQKGAVGMEKKIDKVDGKVDGLKNWLIATLAGVVASIFINLVKG